MSEVIRYAEREKAWQRSELRVKNEKQLAQGFQVANIYLNRTYLDNFSNAPIIAASRSVMDASKLRLIEISKLVFDASERFTDKLISVYSAIYSLDSSVALILDSDGNKVRFYIGTRSDKNTSIAGDILEATLKGNFPGVVYDALDASKTNCFVSDLKNSGIKSMAAVSVVPSIRENSDGKMEEFVQGIEKFIDTMSGRIYTMICLATPLDPATMQKRKHGFEELCSTLSPHAKLSVAYGENDSIAVNSSVSSSFSKSVNRSVSNSNSTSSSRSSGTNYSESSGSNFGGGYSQDGWSSNWGANSGYSSGSFDSYTSGNAFTQSFSDSSGSSTSDSTIKGETTTKGSSKTITLL